MRFLALLVCWFSLSGVALAAGGVRTVSAATARRYLSAYGWKSSLSRDGVKLPNGEVRALEGGIAYDELLRLTQVLPRRGGKGLLGLSSRSPHVERLADNLERFGAPTKRRALATELRKGDLVEAHRIAAQALAPTSRAPLAARIAPLAEVYMTAGSPAVAGFLARKLGRVDEVGAGVITSQLAAQAGRVDRARTILQRLARRHPDDARVWRTLADVLRTYADQPAIALRYARRAHALAPHDLDNVLALGNASIFAAARQVDPDTNMRAGRAWLRRARRMDEEVVLPEPFFLPRFSLVPQTTAILKRATNALDAGKFDRAETIAQSAFAIDPTATRAHGFIRDVRMLRKLQTSVELTGEQPLPHGLRTEQRREALVRRAVESGIERLVPGFGELDLLHRAIVAHAMLPMKKVWSLMAATEETATIVPPWLSPLALHKDIGRREKTPNHRYFYGVRGTGGYAMFTGREYLDNAAYGELNAYAHEFGHQLEWALPAKQIARLRRLFARGNALDDYAAGDMSEYLAVGYEAFVSEWKSPTATKYTRHTRAELQQRDPALFALLSEWSQTEWPTPR